MNRATRHRALFIAALLIATVGGLTPRPARAYVRTTTRDGVPMRWTHTCMTMTLYPGQPPQFISSDMFVAAARASAASWSKGAIDCTAIDLQVAVTTGAEASVEPDKSHRVMFRHMDWCRVPKDADEPCYPKDALAITSVYANPKTGDVVDADVELNGVYFDWADVTAPGVRPGSQDVQNTLTHEFGHFIGLEHTCFPPNETRPRFRDQKMQPVPICGASSPAEVRATTMYASASAGDVEKRTLEADDRLAVCEIYPKGDTLPCVAPDEGGGGCAMAAVSSARPSTLSFVVVGIGLGLIRRRRLRG